MLSNILLSHSLKMPGSMNTYEYVTKQFILVKWYHFPRLVSCNVAYFRHVSKSLIHTLSLRYFKPRAKMYIVTMATIFFIWKFALYFSLAILAHRLFLSSYPLIFDMNQSIMATIKIISYPDAGTEPIY